MDKVYYETYETSEMYDSMDLNQTEKEVISQSFVFLILWLTERLHSYQNDLKKAHIGHVKHMGPIVILGYTTT